MKSSENTISGIVLSSKYDIIGEHNIFHIIGEHNIFPNFYHTILTKFNIFRPIF